MHEVREVAEQGGRPSGVSKPQLSTTICPFSGLDLGQPQRVRPRSREVERAQSQAGPSSLKPALGCPPFQHWEDGLHLSPDPKKTQSSLFGGIKCFCLVSGAPETAPDMEGSLWPLDSCLPLRACFKVRQTKHACPVRVTWRGLARQVPELQPHRFLRTGRQGRRWAPSHRRLGLGCPSGPLLAVPVLGWCHGLRGREGAGTRSGGLFEASSSSWWQRVQLAN